jgi:hypothetical protein
VAPSSGWRRRGEGLDRRPRLRLVRSREATRGICAPRARAASAAARA